MNAASPGVIAIFQANDFYPDTDAYLAALAEAMKSEYEAIADAGLILQVDCPDLAMGRHVVDSAGDEATFLRRAAMQVEVLNAALENVPPERARLHVCWGNYEGPHHRDIPLEAIADVVLSAKPQGLLFEAANPRHAHEWTVFRDRRGWGRQAPDSRRDRFDDQLLSSTPSLSPSASGASSTLPGANA